MNKWLTIIDFGEGIMRKEHRFFDKMAHLKFPITILLTQWKKVHDLKGTPVKGKDVKVGEIYTHKLTGKLTDWKIGTPVIIKN